MITKMCRDQKHVATLQPKIVRTFARASSDIGPSLEKEALQALYHFWTTCMASRIWFFNQFDQSEYAVYMNANQIGLLKTNRVFLFFSFYKISSKSSFLYRRRFQNPALCEPKGQQYICMVVSPLNLAFASVLKPINTT